MSGSISSQLDEIAKYLEYIKDIRKQTEAKCRSLERERESLEQRIVELNTRNDRVSENLREERVRLEGLDRTIAQVSTTYGKLQESTNSLSDFVKREYANNAK